MSREKKQLIPLEKSKRVIYLDRRGAVKRQKPVAAVSFGVLGIFCLGYFGYQFLFVNTGTMFYMVWGLLAVVCGALSFFLAHRNWVEKIPKGLRWMIKILFGAGVALFLIVEGMVLGQFHASPPPGADVCIILGAQMKTSGPSDVLRRRLDRALEYLRESPDTIVVVSGGQGSDEPVSEAQGMKDYLAAQGIAEERILMEDTSTNTLENLNYSARLIDKGSDHVVIVTNNFHVFRAVAIARKQGYGAVEGMAASTHRGNVLNNLLREFFGVVKDFLVGNL
ncbi:MAG: YdcF family protein [Blautia sp.]|nr:YdcF family protein [Blautia sp.]